jgi:transposase
MTVAFWKRHFFTVENVRWRALPERFGHWNSVWKRLDRLSKAGVFDALASMSASAHLIQVFAANWRADIARRFRPSSVPASATSKRSSSSF